MVVLPTRKLDKSGRISRIRQQGSGYRASGNIFALGISGAGRGGENNKQLSHPGSNYRIHIKTSERGLIQDLLVTIK